MVRLSSQSKSMPVSLVAECSATGMCTRPKLIAPFHKVRGLLPWVAMVMPLVRSRALEAERLHRLGELLPCRGVAGPRVLAAFDALVRVGDGPLVAGGEPVQLVPGARDRHAEPGTGARRVRGRGGGAAPVAQVVDVDAPNPVLRAALGDEPARHDRCAMLDHRLREVFYRVPA